GGTLRSLGKMDQALRAYPLTQTHNYELQNERVLHIMSYLVSLSTEKRKKVPGLSKERVDVILPGLAIAAAVFEHIQATHYVICGTGLRDGLFYTMLKSEKTAVSSPLKYSVDNMLKLHTAIPYEHAQTVTQDSLDLLHTVHHPSREHEKQQRHLMAA